MNGGTSAPCVACRCRVIKSVRKSFSSGLGLPG